MRIRAGNETVSVILYMVTYLSLNPVYEKAVEFAASRCHGPIGNDLKKVVWDVESGRFSNIKEAMGVFSRKWSLWNEDFVKSLIILQLIEAQTTQEGRNEILMMATDRIMTSTYKKMEKYAFGLKIPSLLLLLFGITMPLMALVMFPLISIFLTNSINPFYVAVGYDLILPFFLWWFLFRMISKRPATYSHSEKLEEVPPKKYLEIRKLGIKLPIIPVAFLLGLLICLPGILYFIQLYSQFSIIFSRYPRPQAVLKWGEYCLSRYEPGTMMADTFKAMFVIWGVSAGIIFATFFRSNEPYKFDQFIRKLESDFTDGLFELQSALRQNIPIETALQKVIEHYRRLRKGSSPMAVFFSSLYYRLARMPISLKQALFGKEGLITKLPSTMIKNIMGVVVSSLSRGPLIASAVVKNIFSYLNRLKEIEHIIKKTLKDVLSNLTLQGKYISPFIAAIVASSAVVMIQILQAIAVAIKNIETMYGFGTNIGGSISKTLSLIKLERVMPPTLMEVIAGIYLVEVVIITAIFITGIHRGFNKVYRDYLIWRMMLVAILLFSLVFFTMVRLFQPIILEIGVGK